jgi:transmembrane sensor
MDNDRLTLLFNRYRGRTATQAEEEELFRLIAAPENEPQLERLLTGAWDSFEPGRLSLPEGAEEEILYRILGPEVRLPAKKPILRRLFAAAAAAAAILVIAAGIYFFRGGRQADGPQATLARASQDIAPAGNKALLTLANGVTVPLDSGDNNAIQQGGALVKWHQGHLQYDVQQQGAAGFNTLATPRGGQFRITLPDGSRVWLNSASRLRYPTVFSGSRRIVELEGQGYFEIAQNPQQPFIVQVKDLEVLVLGTGFDIMAYADEQTVNTTLVEGAVKVKRGAAQASLRPGEQAVLHYADNRMQVQQADINKVTAWKNGVFVFNDMDLTAILREVSRWYDVEVIYAAKPHGRLYGGGISRKKNLSGVLHFLETTGDHHFKIEGRKVIVLP